MKKYRFNVGDKVLYNVRGPAVDTSEPTEVVRVKGKWCWTEGSDHDWATVCGSKVEPWKATPQTLEHPLTWKRPRHVIVLSDLFHEAVPFEFIDRVFAVMALCPQHTFQVLTKRPERMAEYMTSDRPKCVVLQTSGAGIACPEKRRRFGVDVRWPIPNVWLGTSVENQAAADERILRLLKCPAAVRFLSVEPLLGAVDFWPEMFGLTGDSWRGPRIDWVIVGGESGPHARPCNVEWIRSIVRQCKDAGVPCFVKQLGARPVHDVMERDATGRPTSWREFKFKDRKGGDPSEWPEDLRVREMPHNITAENQGASK